MNNKKGQTQQVFVYIMVILIVGAVLLFGYKSINNIINKGCDVDFATFQSQLKSTLEKNNGYGDVAPIPLKSPCGYEIICFVNTSTSAITGANQDKLAEISPAIRDEVKAGTGNNVFLIKGTETKPLYALDYLEVPGNESVQEFLCIKQRGGNFNIVLEGIGKGRVKITQGN